MDEEVIYKFAKREGSAAAFNEENDEFRIKTETDNQLNYAIKLLNG